MILVWGDKTPNETTDTQSHDNQATQCTHTDKVVILAQDIGELQGEEEDTVINWCVVVITPQLEWAWYMYIGRIYFIHHMMYEVDIPHPLERRNH